MAVKACISETPTIYGLRYKRNLNLLECDWIGVLELQVDLVSEEVETVAGTGRQREDHEGGRPGLQQAISSPWDLTMGRSIGNVAF